MFNYFFEGVKFKLVFTALASILFIANSSVSAQSRRTAKATPTPKVRTIPCPPIVADKGSGKFQSSRSKNSPVQCFASDKDAKIAGFMSAKALQKIKVEGWYRISVKRTKDSCGGISGPDGPVFFVQVVEQNGAVYTDFCPSTGRHSGVKTEGGFSTVHTEVVRSSTNALSCSDGMVERTEHLELNRALDGSPGFTARLVIVQRCPGEIEGVLSCNTEYTGVAFSETHPIWPPVAHNASLTTGACQQALQTCANCHENLAGLVINR